MSYMIMLPITNGRNDFLSIVGSRFVASTSELTTSLGACIHTEVKLSVTMAIIRGGWSRFLWNAHLIIAHCIQCIVFADSAG